MKPCKCFIVLLYSHLSFPQLAVIRDQDGFANIRDAATSNSKIVDTLSNERVVFCFEDATEGNWLPIDYIRNGKNRSGYIHRSRLAFIDDMEEFQASIQNDSSFTAKLDSINFTIKTKQFTQRGRLLKYFKTDEGHTYLRSIDNKFPWGTDGNIPKKEYKLIEIKYGNKFLRIDKPHWSDLFEPNLDMTSAHFDKQTRKVYLYAFNSDGAGGYLVLWIFKDAQLLKREIFRPF